MAFYRDILRSYNSLNLVQKTRLVLGTLGVAGLALAFGVRLAEDSNEIRNNSMPNFIADLDEAEPSANVELVQGAGNPVGSLVIKGLVGNPDCKVELPISQESDGNIYATSDGTDALAIARNDHGAIRPIPTINDLKQTLVQTLVDRCD